MTAALIAATLIAVVAIVLQVVIPRIGEARIERRLTVSGGQAYVGLAAFPALMLLSRRGDRIEVKGRNLAIGMSQQGGGLSMLDGFREVDIGLQEFTTGPFEVTDFQLSRHGAGNYRMRADALTTGSTLADYSAEPLGNLGAGLISLLAKQAPLGSRSFAVSVDVELASEDGLLTVIGGGGSIGGYPAGPIASFIAAAVARRLEIVY